MLLFIRKPSLITMFQTNNTFKILKSLFFRLKASQGQIGILRKALLNILNTKLFIQVYSKSTNLKAVVNNYIKMTQC